MLQAAVLVLAVPAAAQADFPPLPVGHAGAQVEVVAGGLHDPRGMTLGAGGAIYVAEAGTTTGVFALPKAFNPGAGPPFTWEPSEPPTATRCEVYWPVGPVTPGYTGSIARIDPDGAVTRVVEGLPSAANNLLIGGDRLSVAAVAQAGERLYALVVAGCSHGHPTNPSAVHRVHADGTTTAIADLSNYLRTNPDSKDPSQGDYEPDGSWYALVRAFGAFYAIEPNRGVLVRITDQGAITPVADLIAGAAAIRPDGDGDQTWSALIRHDGAFYVGTLGTIPGDFGASVYRVSKDGARMSLVASGLHGVLGLAFDRQGRLYALETTQAGVNPPLSDPTAGRLVRVEADGSLTPVVTGLAFPTALVAGRNGEFYVTNCGYHCDDPPGSGISASAGQVLRVTIPGSPADPE
jgi:sugar lactone lactonase YvrE